MTRNTRDRYLNAELLRFGDREVYTGREGCEGMVIVAAFGSGNACGGGLPSNVVSVLSSGIANRESRSEADPFWEQAVRELLTHAVELAVLGSPASVGLTGGHR